MLQRSAPAVNKVPGRCEEVVKSVHDLDEVTPRDTYYAVKWSMERGFVDQSTRDEGQ
jgi:hypothetical protein